MCKKCSHNVSTILQDSVTDVQMNCSATAKMDSTSLAGIYTPDTIYMYVNILIIPTEGEHNGEKDIVPIITGS